MRIRGVKEALWTYWTVAFGLNLTRRGGQEQYAVRRPVLKHEPASRLPTSRDKLPDGLQIVPLESATFRPLRRALRAQEAVIRKPIERRPRRTAVQAQPSPPKFSSDPNDPPFWPAAALTYGDKIQRLADLSREKSQVIHGLVDLALRDEWRRAVRTSEGVATLLHLLQG